MPEFEELWSALHDAAQQWVKEPAAFKAFQKLGPQKRSQVLATYSITSAIARIEQFSKARRNNVKEIAIGQHAIPNVAALDKILRYETAIDRSLGRALDRLERLQRRRRGEPVLPPLSMRLTQ